MVGARHWDVPFVVALKLLILDKYRALVADICTSELFCKSARVQVNARRCICGCEEDSMPLRERNVLPFFQPPV